MSSVQYVPGHYFSKLKKVFAGADTIICIYITTLHHHNYFTSFKQTDWFSGKAVGVYSGDPRFECQSQYRLF
jgi:hypothetical protein